MGIMGETLVVNGMEYDLSPADLELTLLDYLRESLGLTGTKNGCAVGACGACTVLVGDKAIRSCVTPVKKILGKPILTIEGLSTGGGALHPVQQAFLDAGAIQCGFCTPGMVMKGVELLQSNRNVKRDIIMKAFRPNLCRCTGYEQIFQAVELADLKWERDID